MATADQVNSLIKAHIEQDDERFKTITLQIAANEARHGHDTFARELKQYAEKIGKGKKNLIRLNNNGNGMFLVTYPSERLSDLVVSSEIQERIERLLIEYRNRNKLQKYGLSNRRKILIEGRPGTGKTFTMQGMVSALGDESLYMSTTFHQSLSYEDFVEGIKPEIKKSDDNSDIRYIIEKGIFYMACEKAAELAGYSSLAECISDDIYSRKEKLDKAIADKKVVLLCIDEINRGNVAAIFGELITLIEESKRLGREDETTATLPYSKKSFGVPSNLRIVGTMNTADRSIQLLDSALRRRFKFVELLPSYTVPYKNDKAITILKRINARVRCLLNKDNQIGHSYLMHAETEKDIFFAVTNKIIPLLEEYFYNDIPKVRFVLNENDDTTYPFYIEDVEAKEAYALFLNESDIDAEEKNFYVLSVNATTNEDYSHYLKHILGEPED